jgi:hypothetical protein
MSGQPKVNPTKAQVSRAAIQRLYISMRHLLTRGSYKPLGISGESMIDAMLSLSPEIYGTMSHPERVELDGMLYIFQRLPHGIEQCRFIKLISREGLENSNFEKIIPRSRVRNCYRIDQEQMFVEMTRGGSDIYDILTHLTFMYIESEKIRRNSLDTKDRKNRAWLMLEQLVHEIEDGKEISATVGFTYLSTLLGRPYDEVAKVYDRFEKAKDVNSLFVIVYWLGRLSMDEFFDQKDREITFSPALREQMGHHIYGERWAQRIKNSLNEQGILSRPIHIVSANLHSVMNCVYAHKALARKVKDMTIEQIAEVLSKSGNDPMRDTVVNYALQNGMTQLSDLSGTNIGVQIIDTALIKGLSETFVTTKKKESESPVIIVMDYAFGEQAYETMDELLKPYTTPENKKINLDIRSVNIMGKAGILEGVKGDIMIPTAHVFEGSADNYPFENDLCVDDFKPTGLGVYQGTMITVMGTSLQNKDILNYFIKSSWRAVGLEMEGAHYQKAIQAASKIRHSISPDVKIRYAYYASDNPLETGSTLASGSLGLDGVKPTYAITLEILKRCLQ